MFSRRRACALVLSAVAAVTVGTRFDLAAQAADASAQPSSAKSVTGYWMLGADGRVFPFGSAGRLGESIGAGRVDLVATPTSNGYWVLTETGGIFSFGDAKFHGAPLPLTGGDRYVSMASTPDGAGYWVFSARGRVLPFGTAQSFGDLSGIPLDGRILDYVATPSGKGYWMVAHHPHSGRNRPGRGPRPTERGPLRPAR